MRTERVTSRLHEKFVEHVNSEVSLGTIRTLEEAVIWVKGTFLWICAREFPKAYGITEGPEMDREVERWFRRRLKDSMDQLCQASIIQQDKEGNYSPTSACHLMSRQCVRFETMAAFLKISDGISIHGLLQTLANAKEFEEYRIRQNEKKVLRSIRSGSVRFVCNKALKSAAEKVECLLQIRAGGLKLESFVLTAEVVAVTDIGLRLL